MNHFLVILDGDSLEKSSLHSFSVDQLVNFINRYISVNNDEPHTVELQLYNKNEVKSEYDIEGAMMNTLSLPMELYNHILIELQQSIPEGYSLETEYVPEESAIFDYSK